MGDERTPWTLYVAAIVGIALMALPDNMGVLIQSTLADANHLCGALIVVIAVISMGEVVRAGRYLNVLSGLSIAIIPWLVSDAFTTLKIIDVIAGVLVAILSLPKGTIKEKYGFWDKYII